MEVIKSYKLHFWGKQVREITKKKKKIISDFAFLSKNLTNLVFKEHHNWVSQWKNMSKNDRDFVRKTFEKEFQQNWLTSGYAQNIYREANSKYNTTKKSFFSKYTKDKTNKKYFRKPYQEDIKEFPLDNRMIKDFKKDEKVENLFWLSIYNPFKQQKGRVNIPLYLYSEVLELLNKWYKYSFSLHSDYVSIIFKYNIEKEHKLLWKDLKDINKVWVDFWKYISTYNGSDSSQFNLSKFYRKIKKIKGQIWILQSSLAEMKNNKKFGSEYDELKEKIKTLHKRVSAIKKYTYNHILNNIVNKNEVVIAEDLNFNVIWKWSPKYKGKKFNKILSTMWRWDWMDRLIYKVLMSGARLVLVNPKYTSQKCSYCWVILKNNRKGRFYVCSSCWHSEDADINASKNIFRIWLNILSQSNEMYSN